MEPEPSTVATFDEEQQNVTASQLLATMEHRLDEAIGCIAHLTDRLNNAEARIRKLEANGRKVFG